MRNVKRSLESVVQCLADQVKNRIHEITPTVRGEEFGLDDAKLVASTNTERLRYISRIRQSLRRSEEANR